MVSPASVSTITGWYSPGQKVAVWILLGEALLRCWLRSKHINLPSPPTCCTRSGSIAQPTAMYLLVAMAGIRRNLMWWLIRSSVTADGRWSGVCLQVQFLHTVNPMFGLAWGASCLKSTGLCTPGQLLCLCLLPKLFFLPKHILGTTF